MTVDSDITLSNIWWNGGIRGFFFRDQAVDTLEELVDAVGGRANPDAFAELESRIESEYNSVEDFEEDCYSSSVEDLLENLGYEVEDEEDY